MPWRQWRNRDQTRRRVRVLRNLRLGFGLRSSRALRFRSIQVESFGELTRPDTAVHLPGRRSEPARRRRGSRRRCLGRRGHRKGIGGVIGRRRGGMRLPGRPLCRNLFQQGGRPGFHLVQFARSQVVERRGLADRPILVRHLSPNSPGPPPGSSHRHRRHHQRKRRRGDGEDDPARPHITRIGLRRPADR